MSPLDVAMKKHMEHIVKVEARPFCVLDFVNFEVDGRTYHMDNGTYRNKMSSLSKKNEVMLQWKSTYAYYSIPGYNFRRDKLITQDHAGLPIKKASQTEIYKWLKNQPAEKQALHDFRLTFSAPGIWDILAKSHSSLINASNKDITFESWKFIDEIDVKVIIHHTHTVSIAVACSSRPIAVEIPDLFYLIEILTRTEVKITNLCEQSGGTTFSIPRYTTWIVKMWHFGFDSHNRYDGKEFHITFQDGISDFWRIYTKRLKDGNHLRAELQQHPNKPPIEAVLDIIFSGGKLND
jgi:hypothetical protein